MLGLVGLLGALMAGILADSMMTFKPPQVSDDQPPADDDADPVHIVDAASGAHASPDDPDYRPTSVDTPQVADIDRNLMADADGDILTGEGGQDTLTGGEGRDQLSGRGGHDIMVAGRADDLVFAGIGNDTALGGDGDDRLEGEAGSDLLKGGAGQDALAGHAAADSLLGEDGSDTLQGGMGDDALSGGDDDDWLAGGWDDDELAGDAGSDTLDGGQGDDTLYGADADVDFLNGGEGNDRMMLGAGDYGSGQAGEDAFTLAEYGLGAVPAWIADYDGDADEIVVMYDPAVHPDPSVTTETVEGSDDVSVLLDGIAVAVVQGGAGLSSADIRLMAA